MIRNVPELQEVNRSEVVMGEVETLTLETLATALFTIHVETQ
jgi:hypothetical protein